MICKEAETTHSDTQTWRPQVFDTARPEDREALAALHATGRVWRVSDTLAGQQQALDEVRRLRGAALAPAAAEGERWIYYPWSGELVRLLPPAAFRELRASRNMYKLTAAEQGRLGELCVGIVGLSSGAVMAQTMALEGVGGRFKLADFDRLELSNLNRLRAGVSALGLRKAVVVARQIAEVDPYVRLTLLPEGVTGANVDAFLGGAEPVDVVIDACDSLDVKVLVRERARALGIPVLMQTSDRGMMDVERFDEEPERAILHGLLGRLRSADLAHLPAAARLGVAAQMVGARSVSTRMAASALEIGHTLATWPQLASEVTLGGAAVTAAVRRLGLGQALPSGRRYIDLDALLAQVPAPIADGPNRTRHGPETKIAASAAAVGAEPCPEWARYLVAHAAMAPSGGNVQPWRFHVEPARLWLSVDRARERNLLSVERRPAHLALGATLENLDIAAAASGWSLETALFPRPGDSDVVAAMTRAPAGPGAVRALGSLIDLVQARCTNRKLGTGERLGADERTRLRAAADERGAHLELVGPGDRRGGEPALARVAAMVGASERVRCLCAALHGELVAELRWSAEEAAQTGDGIDVATLEMSDAELTAVRLLARPEVAAFLREQDGGRALAGGRTRAQIESASAVGLLSVAGDGPEDWLAAGRAMQRVWLEATRLGLGVQPVGVLIYLLHMLDAPAGEVLAPRERALLAAQKAQLDAVFPHSRGRVAAMMFRLVRAAPPSVRSLRRPLGAILLAGAPPQADTAQTPAPGQQHGRARRGRGRRLAS
jgi:hypothetical protein